MQLARSTEVSTREDLSVLCNRRYSDSHAQYIRLAVEIGVHCAAFTVPFLSKWSGRMLYAIDPWQSDLPDYTDILNEKGRDRSADMMLALCALSRFNGRVTPLRAKSDQAAGWIPNDLEFVYIDGNHMRNYQYADMKAYWKKLRHNGILAGHDLDGSWKDETMWALEKFTTENHIQVVNFIPNVEAASWYVIKS